MDTLVGQMIIHLIDLKLFKVTTILMTKTNLRTLFFLC